MRKPLRTVVLIALLALLLALPLAAQQQGSWYYHWTRIGPSGTPDAGWVAVQWSVTASCSGCTCGSSWSPSIYSNLWEKPADREVVGRSSGRMGAGRPVCPAGTAGAGQAVAGTWYHNGSAGISCNTYINDTNWQTMEKWGVAECVYTGIVADWWTFAPDDDCCEGDSCGGGGDPTPDPDPCTCPGDTWQYATPGAGILEWEPPYPVVINQDPQRRGVAVSLMVWIDPAIRT